MIHTIAERAHGPLKPGVEYYFNEGPVHGYYVSQTYTSKPLPEEQAEASDYIRIGVVREDQKIDHDTTYQRKREPFPLNAKNFAMIADGTHFYHLGANFTLIPVTISQALHSEDYVKVVKTSGEIKESVHVTTPSMGTTHYTYYPNGHFRSDSGTKRDGAVSETSELQFDEHTGQPTVLTINGVVQK